jgi:hypothetical protein
MVNNEAPEPTWLQRLPALGRTAATQHQKRQRPRGIRSFQPLAPPSGGANPFHMQVADVLASETITVIEGADKLVFHCVGDTGGMVQPLPQLTVATNMGRDFTRRGAPPGFGELGA